MNIQYIKHILIAVVAITILASCGGDPNIESAKLNLANNDFDGVIASAETALEENPENALAYYYIGLAHLGKSETKPLGEQSEDLVNARENLNKAHEMFTAQGVESEEATMSKDLLVARWQNFYMDAVDPIDFEGTNEPDQLQLSIDNLHNAIAVAPDTVMNYDALSEVYFLSEDVDNAIDYMKKAIDMAEEPDLVRYQRIAYFYTVNEDEDGALEVLQDARSRFPAEAYFAQEVANIYLRRGETDTAIDVLLELVEIDPENPEYRLVIGSQVYRAYLDMNKEVNEMYDEIFDINTKYREEARKSRPDTRKLQEFDTRTEELAEKIMATNDAQFEIADQAEEHLLISYELDPENPNTTYILGAVNENRGLALLDQRNLTDDVNKASELETRAMEHITASLPYFEQTAQLEDTEENWLKLFQIYTRLGMSEKAEEAMGKAGL